VLVLVALAGAAPGVAGLAIVRFTEFEVTATRQKEAIETDTAELTVVALLIWPVRTKAHRAPTRTALRDFFVIFPRLSLGSNGVRQG
jgi:hypothetical protein